MLLELRLLVAAERLAQLYTIGGAAPCWIGAKLEEAAILAVGTWFSRASPSAWAVEAQEGTIFGKTGGQIRAVCEAKPSIMILRPVPTFGKIEEQ